MPKRPDWRSPSAVETLHRLDRARICVGVPTAQSPVPERLQPDPQRCPEIDPSGGSCRPAMGALFSPAIPSWHPPPLRSSGDRSLCLTA